MSAVPIFSQRGRKQEVTHQIVDLTPAMAEKFLGRNRGNRNVRKTKVVEFARDMSAGRWVFNGDPIRFSASGRMLDGQHRCLAVVKSGVTIQVIVIQNLPDEAQNTMDIGARRTMSDQLMLSGERNSTTLAAVLRRVVAHRLTGSWTRGTAATFAEMRDFYELNPEITFAVDVAMKARVLPCAPSTIGALYHVCAAVDRGDAEHFFVDQLIDGVGLSRNDPAYALRVKLRSGDRLTPGETERRLSDDNVIRYALTAWNLFRDGRKIQKLQAPKGGWGGKFPEPK